MKIKQMDYDGKGTKAYRFFCPGCQEHHAPTSNWQFNGDFNKPTFSPSILVRGSKMTDKGRSDYDAWYEAGRPTREGGFETVPTICHSFVRDGTIQFLLDCTHELAGQTVELPDLEY